jgi:hypothetical protein
MRNLFILSALVFVVVTGAAAGVVAMTLTSPHSVASSGYRIGPTKAFLPESRQGGELIAAIEGCAKASRCFAWALVRGLLEDDPKLLFP